MSPYQIYFPSWISGETAVAVNIFFMGKGGVGKSTTASLTAVSLARQGHSVLIASFDPAHNLSDIFNKGMNERPSELMQNLVALEINQALWIKRYLKSIHDQISRTYSYLTALNLDKHFKVIKHSPGLEEYALILAFKYTTKAFGDKDFLLFDMPPTALALKFFNLPKISLIWIENLLELRQEIIQKRELITRVKLMKIEIEKDKVLNKIHEMKAEYTSLKNFFENREQTKINLVLNPDRLSFAESKRILEDLSDIDIFIDHVIYNKMHPDSSCVEIERIFEEIPRLTVPYSDIPLVGMDALQTFLAENGDLMARPYELCTKTS
jgi:arsenite-transporting ATPase